MKLLPKSTNKVAIKIGINSEERQPYICLLDTGAGTDLINKASLKREWLSDIKRQQLRGLRTVTKEDVLFGGTIPFFVKIGKIKVRVWFEIVEAFAVDILLGTYFIDGYFRGIFLSERKVLPRHSALLQLLSRSNSATVQLLLHEQDSSEFLVKTIRVAQRTVVAPRIQVCLPVTTSASKIFQF